jgi:hypothetical protein
MVGVTSSILVPPTSICAVIRDGRAEAKPAIHGRTFQMNQKPFASDGWIAATTGYVVRKNTITMTRTFNFSM